jgi:methylated-DNA-[protein]-cysteine S-methyltransferase
MIDLESRLRAAAGEAAQGPLPELPELPGLPELLDITQAADSAGLLDVAYALTDSPLGQLLLASTPRGIVRISYLDAGEDVDQALRDLAARVSPRILRAPGKLDAPRRELDEFFSGARRDFDLQVDLRLAGPGFRRRVLAATARIPFGDSRSYKQVAGAAGSPNAFRAAGTALGSNPLPIVIPCHRVRHAGGGIGGYTGGLERKRKLLALEAAQH